MKQSDEDLLRSVAMARQKCGEELLVALTALEEKRNKCPVHAGARVACGQCHDTALTRLEVEKEETRGLRATNEIGADLIETLKAENTVLKSQLEVAQCFVSEVNTTNGALRVEILTTLGQRDLARRELRKKIK